MELQVKPQEFGIEPKKASELMGNLPQIKSEREILLSQANEVLTLDLDDPGTSKKAREIRLLLRDNRTKGILVWHKTTKDFFLKGGQFVDAIKRMEVAVNERAEEQLEQVEKYAEIKEAKRLDALQADRLVQLEPYKDFVPFGVDLRTMEDAEFDKLYNGAKLQYEAEQARLEAERIAAEKEAARQRLIKGNREALLPWALWIPDFAGLDFELIDVAQILSDAKKAKAKDEAEKEAQRVENEKLKKQAAELEAKREAELKAERKKQAKLQAELDAKKAAEIKAEQERVAAEQAAKLAAEEAAKAPIKEQLKKWVDGFQIDGAPIYNETSVEIQAKFTAFKSWAVKQISNL
jgi:hypothetical protein